MSSCVDGKPESGVVISGLGVSPPQRPSTKSGLRLTVDAIRAAVDDAGLEFDDIDGLATYPGLTVDFVPGYVGPDLYEVQDALNLRLNWHLAVPQGAAQIAPLIEATLAVACGLCRHAVVFRTVTEVSARRGRRAAIGAGMATARGPLAWLLPAGAVAGANWGGLYAQRHMYEYGTTREHLGWLAVTERAHAAANPEAVFSMPLSLDDYFSAPMVSTPLCRLDCDVPVDGATAVVVSSVAAASDDSRAVRIEAMGGALLHRPLWEQWEDLTTMAAHDAAAQLWSRTDLTPADVDVAQLYDGFSIFTLLWLEAFGFCGRGESGPFVEGGSRIGLGGQLPLNTSGGQLSGGRLHGWGFVAEAIRQLRGEAGARQVPDAEVAAVGVGGGPIAGALLLTRR